MFDADNLRPYRKASVFFDDIAVNHVTQRANLIEVNARKQISISTTQSYTAVTTDVAWQGSSFTNKTFSSVVASYNSSTKVLIVADISGFFDESAPLYISNSTGATLKVTATVLDSESQNSASTFSQDEEVYVQRTNAYMVVVGTSGENIVYLNENFIYCNVISTTTSLSTTHFQDGDLVYQTASGSAPFEKANFIGKVKYFQPQASANVLTIEPISGILRTNFNTANNRINLRNESNPSAPVIKVLNTRLNNYGAGDTLVSIDTGKRLQVTSRKHYSGVIANTVQKYTGLWTNEDRTVLQLSANVGQELDGRLIHITSGRGAIQTKRIVAILDNAVRVNTGVSDLKVGSTSHYSIGDLVVDENGGLAGIFNLPEEPEYKFKTGERIFTITDTDKVDNPNFTMKASAKFTASGLLNITQRITSTPVSQPLPEFSGDNPVAPSNLTQDADAAGSPSLGTNADSIVRPKFVNGLSQTFFTPKASSNKVNRGIFVTSVDLFFKSKPSKARGSMQLPVNLRIAQVVNGYPTKNYIARTKVDASDVKVSTKPDVTNAKTKTTFRFRDPVYLEPDTEYALTVGSESPEYELWIAELGQDVLNASPPRRISDQPYAGSLFKSQNSSTWTAYQNQDLMFVINKAVFNTSSGYALFKMKDPPKANLDVGKVILHTNDLGFGNAVTDYTIKSYRKNPSTNVATEEVNYTDIKPHKMLRYGELADKSASLTNTRFINKGKRDSIVVRADLTTTDPNISPIINKESISVAVSEYVINNAELSNNIISIATKGLGYKKVPNGNLVGSTLYTATDYTTLNAAATAHRTTYYDGDANIAYYGLVINSTVGSGAKGFAVANTDGTNRIDSIFMVSEGSGYYETPTITLAPPEDLSGQEEALIIARGETGKWGGNIKARYQTRQIALLEGFEAGDLIVFMDAIRPVGTDIQVYYKVLGIDDTEKFWEKTWVRMERRSDIFSKDSNSIREFEYRPSFTKNELSYVLDGVEYPIGRVFKSFAVKVCLTSSDLAVVPYIRNIRISAVPAG
jgi:hypothetical protein